MRILERYITRSVVVIFTVTLLTFCFLYILIDITSQLDEFIDRKVDPASGRLDLKFDSGNAQGIFKMTASLDA